MQLYEKLIFLMNLTQTSNRVLARELRVDPSLISRLRTGSRGVPRNREYLRAMARYFANQCVTDYQHQALAGMLGVKQAVTMKKEQLSEVLFYWLCGESDEVGRFMRTFETLGLESAPQKGDAASSSLNLDNSVYYGNEGKRAAARAVYSHLLSLEQPGVLFVFSDEADDWISEDYEFSCRLQEWGLTLLRQGFHLCQITPPTTSLEQSFSSLTRWLPLYLTGRAEAYFYPRIRDNFHRRTLIVLPGEIAMISSSSASRRASNATIVTTDRRLTQVYGVEFRDYLSLCQPMMNTYRTPARMMQCFTQFLSTTGARIQKVPSLSAETAPAALMAHCTAQLANEDLAKLNALHLQELRALDHGPENQKLVDIACLASAAEVRAGKVPIILSFGCGVPPLSYTPELYVLHLKSILHLLETHENYHFIPFRKSDEREAMLLVKESRQALLVRTTDPFSVFEITQPDIVRLCVEHLLQIADRAGYLGIQRVKTISQIKELIRELQG